MKLFRMSTIVEHVSIYIACFLLQMKERYFERDRVAQTEEEGVVVTPGAAMLGEIPGTAPTV